MIDQLLTYGPLGIWTAVLLYEKFRMQKKVDQSNTRMIKVIEANTRALRTVKSQLKRSN